MEMKTYMSHTKRRALFKMSGLAIMAIFAATLWGCADKKEAVPPQAQTNAPAIKKQQGDPAAGRLIYVKYCHYCHGTKGLGDGPVGLAIVPRPADLVNDTSRMSKTDEELFKSISNGIKRDVGGDAMFMPSWKDILSEQERWNVLSYVRQLEHEGKAARK